MNELTAEIYRVLPDLKKLGVGCEFRFKHTDYNIFGHKKFAIGSDKSTCDIYMVTNKHINAFGYEFYEDDLIIIGKPIGLNDILRYLDTKKVKPAGNYFLGAKYIEFLTNRNSILDNWDLSKNLLSQQSKTLIDIVKNIIIANQQK